MLEDMHIVGTLTNLRYRHTVAVPLRIGRFHNRPSCINRAIVVGPAKTVANYADSKIRTKSNILGRELKNPRRRQFDFLTGHFDFPQFRIPYQFYGYFRIIHNRVIERDQQ